MLSSSNLINDREHRKVSIRAYQKWQPFLYVKKLHEPYIFLEVLHETILFQTYITSTDVETDDWVCGNEHKTHRNKIGKLFTIRVSFVIFTYE